MMSSGPFAKGGVQIDGAPLVSHAFLGLAALMKE